MCACADNMQMTYMPADDMWMTCRWHPDDICHPPPEISNEVSLSCRLHVIHASSAHHLHVVCMSSARRTHETSVPRLFQVKQQRTALLKMNKPPFEYFRHLYLNSSVFARCLALNSVCAWPGYRYQQVLYFPSINFIFGLLRYGVIVLNYLYFCGKNNCVRLKVAVDV